MASMFQILNDVEVRLMGRKYLYKGDELYTIQEREEIPGEAWDFDAWKGDLVKNHYTLRQFKQLRQQNGWANTVLDIVSEKRDVIMDRWEYAIREAVKFYPEGFRLSELITPVCMILGSDEDQAAAGITYHPYNGKLITKNIQGWIATWIEERSPDSRQRYFIAGKRYNSNKPLLFINDGLYEANTRSEWKPYSYVRGSRWQMNPAEAEARQQPDDETLNSAALLYRKQGMRGAKNRTTVSQDIAGTERVPNVAGIAVGVMAFMGAFGAIL